MGMNDLVQKLRDQPQTVDDHFAEKLSEWVADVGDLMSNIESWLQPAIDEGLVRVTRRTIDLDEPDTGPYEVSALTIHLGDRRVEVEPRGMQIVGVIPTGRDRIIGARGRVDLVSGASRATLLRRADRVWQLASTDAWPASKSAVDLDEETFADALSELIS